MAFSKSRRNAQTQIPESNIDTATFPAPLPFAVHGEIKSTQESVVLLQSGDVPGHSASYLAINQDGDSDWVSFDDVQITDPRALPVTVPEQSRRQRAMRNR